MSASAPLPAISWKEVTERRFWQQLEVLPPAFQAGYGFLVGEPYEHRACARTGAFVEACAAFYETEGRYFEASGPMTEAEFRAVDAANVLASAAGIATPYVLSQAEGELIELVNGAAESSFVCTITHSPETGWRIIFTDTAIDRERDVTGASFHEAWMALRHWPKALVAIKGGRQ